MKHILYFRLSVFTIWFLYAGIWTDAAYAQGWIQNFGILDENWQGEEIETLPTGGYIIGGQTSFYNNVYIARLDEEGDTIWTREIPATYPWSEIWLMDMETGPDGATHMVLFNLPDWVISYVRMDINGNMEDEYPVYETALSEYLISLVIAQDGIVFAGAVNQTDSTLLMKRSFDGELLWTKSLPTPGGVVEIQQDAEGNFILLVEVNDYDYEIVKADSNGEFLWRVWAPGTLYRGSIAVQPDGRIIYASGVGTGIQLLHISADGDMVNIVQDNVFPNKKKIVERIISDATGNLYITGTIWVVPGEDYDLMLVKYNPGLARLGYHSYDQGEDFWIGKDLELVDDNSLTVCSTRSTLSDAWEHLNFICVLNLPIDAVTDVQEAAFDYGSSVKPNPFSDYVSFIVDKGEPGVKTIKIYSLNGKLLRMHEFSGMQYQMSAGDLPAGVLFYQIMGNESTISCGYLIKN